MNRLSVRLTIAFLLLTWLSIGAIAFVLQDTIEGGFRDYVQGQDVTSVPENLPASLSGYYTQNGTWLGAESLLPGAGRGNAENRGNQGRQYFIVDIDGVIVASSDATRIGDRYAKDDLQSAIALHQDGQQMGWLAWQTPGQQRFGAAEQAFLDDMTETLLGIGGVAGILALIFGGGLAWGLTRPLGHLTQAVQKLSAGHHEQVTPEGTTELRQLATAFNEMSNALEHSEHARQRIAADVAHELRTPVTVLSGHLEGMLDDVVPTEKAQIALAYDQTLHLKRLIEDLRLLTLAEVKQLPLKKGQVDTSAFLQKLIAAFEPLALDAELTLVGDYAENLPPLHADEGRLMQVFGNLLTNALRHTTAGGTITVAARIEGQRLCFQVSNTGAQLAPQDAERLFDPFWRAEEARDRESGGSGLGLAIVKGLVELHGGQVRAETSDAATHFIIELPYGDAIGGAVASHERR